MLYEFDRLIMRTMEADTRETEGMVREQSRME
jgi:hypothetical protein